LTGQNDRRVRVHECGTRGKGGQLAPVTADGAQRAHDVAATQHRQRMRDHLRSGLLQSFRQRSALGKHAQRAPALRIQPARNRQQLAVRPVQIGGAVKDEDGAGQAGASTRALRSSIARSITPSLSIDATGPGSQTPASRRSE
jgi:hypothetical protein